MNLNSKQTFKNTVIEKITLLKKLIFYLHTEDETNRNTETLKKDMALVLVFEKNVKNNELNIKKMKTLNKMYLRYTQWKRDYDDK